VLLCLFALAVVNACTTLGWSQDGEDRPPRPPRRPAAGAAGQGNQPERDRFWDESTRLGARRWAGELPIRPGPADEGPLRPGEEEELFNFAQRAFPIQMVSAMRRLKVRNPEEFRRVMELRAPHLRFLRRLFRVNPQLARDVLDHAATMNAIRRAREFLRAGPEAPGRQQRAIQLIRERCAASVRLEARILAERARMLEAAREEEIRLAVERLSAPDAELAAEPPEIREAVQALHGAADARTLAEARARLEELLTARLDQEIQELRQREQRLRAQGAAEVDRRIARVLAGLAPFRRPPPEEGVIEDNE
jgi:hypothetical protein